MGFIIEVVVKGSETLKSRNAIVFMQLHDYYFLILTQNLGVIVDKAVREHSDKHSFVKRFKMRLIVNFPL